MRAALVVIEVTASVVLLAPPESSFARCGTSSRSIRVFQVGQCAYATYRTAMATV